MLITAEQKNSRQTSRKVKMVADQVRKMPLEKAIAQLGVIERDASEVILKLMKQAISNATHNMGFKLEDLTLVNIIVSDGPIYRRMRPVSRGRGHAIDKKTCHVKVILEAKES